MHVMCYSVRVQELKRPNRCQSLSVITIVFLRHQHCLGSNKLEMLAKCVDTLSL